MIYSYLLWKDAHAIKQDVIYPAWECFLDSV